MFPEQLRGMFGIAVWDQTRRRGVIARDRLGIKPIYYAVCGDSARLRLRAQEPARQRARPDRPRLRGDRRVPLARILPGAGDAARGGEEARAGLHPRRSRTARSRSGGSGAIRSRRSSAAAASRSGASVCSPSSRSPFALRLMSDVPLGAMLSGGLDSSLIVALMAQQMDRPVQTFAVGFAEAGASNELADARFVADVARRRPPRARALVRRGDDLRSTDLVWHLDEPLADLSSLGFIALSELAAQHVTVALSGQGADELLGGYRKHRAAAHRRHVAARARHRSGALLSPRRPTARDGCAGRSRRSRAAGRGRAAALDERRARRPTLRRRLVRGPLAELDGNAALARDLVPARRLPGRAAAGHALPRRAARPCRRHAPLLRSRVDGALARGARAVPRPSRRRAVRDDAGEAEGAARLETKHVLRHAARGLVPDRIIDKPKIGFFNAAVDGWFRAQTRGAISDYLLGAEPALRGDARPDARSSGSSRARPTAAGGNTYVLLSVLMLEVWLSEYLPRARRPAPARRSPRA